MKKLLFTRLLGIVCLSAWPVQAATEMATFAFSGSLAAIQPGVPSLTATDPLSQNVFLTDTVFGVEDSVYRFVGTSSPANQAGLSLDTSGLATADSYSVALIFSLDGTSGYRRIVDVQNRQSDAGFYVNPGNHLTVYPASGTGPNDFSPGYHHVVLTVAPDGTVKGYIDGLTDFTSSTTVMDINNTDNPGAVMNFFLDNVVAGGQGEFSSGNIAQLSLYDGVLTDAEALALSQHALVPETSSLLLLGLTGLLGLRRRRAN